MSAVAELEIRRFLRLKTEHFLDAGTDESVVRSGIENKNEVGKTGDKAPCKLLLLMEAALHFAALGDIHDGALVTGDVTGRIADGGRGIEADDGRAVLPNESDFAALDHGLALDLFLQLLSLDAVDKDLLDILREKFGFRAVAEHAHERGIGVENRAIGRGDIDAFLK